MREPKITRIGDRLRIRQMHGLYPSTRWLLEYKTTRNVWRVELTSDSPFKLKEEADKIFWLAQLGMLDGKKPFEKLGE